MNKIARGLCTLLLIAAALQPASAQDTTTISTQTRPECAEYFGCLNYGVLTQAQARTARGHPQFVERETSPAPGTQVSATPNRAAQASRTGAPSLQ